MSAGGRILAAWAALLALLALTIGATFLPLGLLLPALSYGIAAAKAGIIVWVFMEMRSRDGLERMALTTGFGWLSLLLALVLADRLTRAWIGG